MGLILDTQSEILGVEIRRESVSLLDLKRKGPYETGEEETTSEHVYTYGHGSIELSKEWLKELIAFFNKPENVAYLDIK